MLYFLIAFTVLGAGIKFIDAAYDEKTFNKKIALIVAPLLGILWAYTMLINTVAATILLAVVFGVLFKGKIDNIAHFAGLAMIIAIIVFAGVQLLILPLIFLAASALLDEVGNDFIDKNKDKSNKFTVIFFDHRWLMKVSILWLCVIGVIPFYFFVAMLFFDYAYITVSLYSRVKQGISSYPNIPMMFSKVKNFVWAEKDIEGI